MLDPVNEILRDLIQSRVPALAGPSQIGFEPPDEAWKASAHGAGEDRLNIYLYEIREDLKYRTSERSVSVQNGWLRETKAAERIDCHYLITAWSPMTFSPPGAEPTRDEHRLLYQVLGVLLRNRPLVPADVYATNIVMPSGHKLLTDVPPELQQSSLPLEAALADQIRDLGDFWGTMRVAWRPTIGLTVTIPMLPGPADVDTPPVTTLSAVSFAEQAADSEAWSTIGGRVLQGAGDTPVANAWVEIHGVSPEVVQVRRRMLSRTGGEFIFERLRAGQYHLRTVAAGLGDIGRDLDVPSPSGEYELRFP